MKKLHKIALLLTCSILLSGLAAACGPEDPNADIVSPVPESEENQPAQEVEQGLPEASSIKSLLSETPKHISEVLGDNFVVEADVHVPDVEKADILFAKLMEFDEKKLLSVFFKGKTPERSLTDYDDSVSYSDANAYLHINRGWLVYSMQDFEYVKFPIDSFVPKSDISGYRQFADVYTQENLSSMTRTEMLPIVLEFLRELSVPVMETAEIYAIDSSTMQNQQRERIQEEIDRQKEAGISTIQDPTFGYKTKERYTEEDEFYLLFFQTELNNIPVTEKSYIIQANERAMNGSTVTVAFSPRKGMLEVYLNGIYEQQGVAESPNALISLKEALYKAYEEQNAIISTDKVTVTAVDFEYVPVPYNKNYNEVKLVPAWCLTVSYELSIDKPSKDGKTNSSVSHRKGIIFINAVTGEKIQ